jgi:hypothetical protein
MARNDLGRRAICGRCDLEIERHPPIWLDRGGNARCDIPGQPLHLAAGENVWTLLGETAKRHMRAICSDNVTRSNIIGLRKALNADWRRRRQYSVSVTAPNVCREEIEQLESAVMERMPRVTGELDESGRKLLRGRRYAKRLAPVADILADLQRFHLIGFGEHQPGHYIPVYRAYDSRGRHFTFRNIAWQSGGDGPELLAFDKKGL